MSLENETQRDENQEVDESLSIFTDLHGRDWNLRLTFGSALSLKNEFGFDVQKLFIGGDNALRNLVDDPWQLVAVILFLTKSAREARGVTEEQFLDGLGGDTLDQATRAFLYGLTGSLKKFQRRVLRSLLRNMETQADATMEKAERLVERKLGEMSEMIDSRIGELGSAALDYSELTPAPGPSAN